MAQSGSLAKDWAVIQRLIGGIHGVSIAPQSNVVTPKYTSGALMGNGDIGVVAGDGSTSRQSFYFGKSDFWGAHDTVRHNSPSCNWNCKVSILTLGKITISSSAKSVGAENVYRVEQDILHAQVKTTLKLGTSIVHLRSWTADGENTFVTEMVSDGINTAELPIEIALTVPTPDPAFHDIFPSAAGGRHGVLWASRENSATGLKEYKAREAIAIRLLGADFSEVKTLPYKATGRFTLKANTPVWIIAAFESDARMGLAGPKSAELVGSTIARAERLSLAQVRVQEKLHLDWWKHFWLKSFVQIHDKVLEEYYYGALYVLGSTIRQHKLAPSLWGNFVTTDDAAWGGIYFMNYNEEAPYYGTFSSNHTELAESYNRMVLAQIPWEKNLTAAAGFKGVSYERVFSPFTEVAGPPALIPVAPKKDYTKLPSDQKSNATFSFLPAIQYYEYSQDKSFLRNQLYPAMKELDAFWRDFAVRDSSGSHWVFEHSSAHEGGDDVNPNLDIGFARRVERELISTSQVLGIDNEMRPIWQSFLDELSPYPTGSVNGKTVYLIAKSIKNKSENHGLFEPGDQPINLEGTVFPGENLSIGGNAQQLQIAKNSLQEMNSWGVTEGGNTENGFCKIFPIAARIGWPADDLVIKLRAAILHQWRPSNLTVFQEGGGIETSGSIEAIDSMLLQHEDGVLRVFPDWPISMDASFTRLRAKGAFLISSEQHDGVVTSIEVFSEHGGPLTVQSPWGTHIVHRSDTSTMMHPNIRGEIHLNTKRGVHYLLAMQ
jgi:hypothetical protein